jgi:hypothetical protein
VLIKKPVVWQAIEAIAKELLKKETLSGKEAFRIWSDIHEEEERRLEKISQESMKNIKITIIKSSEL